MSVASSDIQRSIERRLRELEMGIRQNMAAEGLDATYDTVNSMEVIMRQDGGTLFGRGAFGTVEQGRKPGATPRDLPMRIRRWAEAKGITPEQIPYKRQPSANWLPMYSVEERSWIRFSEAVAHSIRMRGTQLYQKGGKPVIYTPLIEQIIVELQDDILTTLASELYKK